LVTIFPFSTPTLIPQVVLLFTLQPNPLAGFGMGKMHPFLSRRRRAIVGRAVDLRTVSHNVRSEYKKAEN
jgi:hypothetical protein